MFIKMFLIPGIGVCMTVCSFSSLTIIEFPTYKILFILWLKESLRLIFDNRYQWFILYLTFIKWRIIDILCWEFTKYVDFTWHSNSTRWTTCFHYPEGTRKLSLSFFIKRTNFKNDSKMFSVWSIITILSSLLDNND